MFCSYNWEMKEMDAADHYLICLFAGWVDVVCPPADHCTLE